MKLSSSIFAFVSVCAATALATPADARPASSENLQSAPAACELADGLPGSVSAAFDQAEACLAGAPSGVTVRQDLLADVAALSERHRVRLGLATLGDRDTLSGAALIHAMDMAAREYAAHEDLEGRSHLYRMRLLDRQVLISSSGANVIVLPAEGTTAIDVFNAIISDPVNDANLSRAGFTDSGLGIVEANGLLYVVQVFARVEGELAQPMPVALSDRTSLRMSLAETGFRFDGWTLAGADGRNLERGINPLIASPSRGQDEAFLEVSVSNGLETYVLKGPLTER